MTAEVWIHIIELVIVTLLIPTAKTVGSVVVGLRDATRDLVNVTANILKTQADHETRLRLVEQAAGYEGTDRRHREPRATDR